ncbi:hypothetical protein STAFG_4591 [Streptomyces afghaniensis 772]|uniref:Uncharacterized protein n=1 Tax=Streptomyces afghaniensis 772 TaxID=1283301 RepID=S4MS35_9ACTN|nr:MULTISPECIES: hypothetical protein [Streptomyces]EPJ38330.1 hypothetical protein STAFG_4591 [Streptomyces afghaniensis 772]UOB12084.1 hypothetical protein MQE23_24825 [Streptomyces sp. HP-A2021]
MGIESDQVVYEYLSRVGDVAQQRQLSSATRMRLVADLRNEIDKRRAKATVDSPAAVRRILSRLGSPDEIVAAAADGTGTGTGTVGGGTAQNAPAAVPVQREAREPEETGERPKGVLRRVVPRPRPARPAEESHPAAGGAAPPHLAAGHELGDSAVQPDWWRVDSSPFGVGDEVPGFVGGVELPDLLKQPTPRKPELEKQAADEEPAPAVEVAGAPEETAGKATRRRLPGLPAGGWSNPLLLIAAGLLVAGAVLGNWFVLILGWLIAYASRRLTPAETKWAVVILPSLSVAAGILWLWGRTNDRWGAPIAEGHMNDAVAQTWPWVVRGAAVASALFLVWRSQRSR